MTFIESYAITNVGRVRGNNEDNFYLCGQYKESTETLNCSAHFSGSEEEMLFGVCDGMGGIQFGEIASMIAIEAMNRYAVGFSHNYAECIKEANDAICEEMLNRGGKRIGSTFSALCIKDGKAVAYNVGDSRIYRLHKGGFEQISLDHTQAQMMIRQGLMTEEQARHHKASHILTQHLGIFEDEMLIEPEVSKPFALSEGDIFLLCSDGLTDMLEDTEICELLAGEGSVESKAKDLIEQALKNGGRDNVTVVLLQIISADKPAAEALPCEKTGRIIQSPTQAKASPVPAKAPAPSQSPKLNIRFLIAALAFAAAIIVLTVTFLHKGGTDAPEGSKNPIATDETSESAVPSKVIDPEPTESFTQQPDFTVSPVDTDTPNKSDPPSKTQEPVKPIESIEPERSPLPSEALHSQIPQNTPRNSQTSQNPPQNYKPPQTTPTFPESTPEQSENFSGVCGNGLEWSYDLSSYSLTISGSGKMYDYSTETGSNGQQYTNAPWRDFYRQIKTVTIQSGVTSIGKAAFFGCSNIDSVSIAGSVENIGDSAFCWCSRIKNLRIPDSVHTIGNAAFYCCSDLESVTVGKGVKQIENSAFYGCNDLEHVYYNGTSQQWYEIIISSGNNNLITAMQNISSK